MRPTPVPDPNPFRRRAVIVAVVGARLWIFAFLYLLFRTTEVREARRDFLFVPAGQTRAEREVEIAESFWARLAPFDGQFYLDVAHHGYRTLAWSIDAPLGNYAFFPLLPFLLSMLAGVFGAAHVPLAIAASAMFAATIGTLAIWKLAERFGASGLAAAAVVITFPSAPFQYVLYTEAFFLALSALAILAALEKRAGAALVYGLLAGLTRPQGVLLALVAFAELAWPRPATESATTIASKTAWKPLPARERWLRVGAILAPASGFIALAGISYRVTGSPSAFLSVQRNWGREYEASGILDALRGVHGYTGPPLDIAGLVLALALLPVVWRRLPRSLALYALGTVAMPLATGSILSCARFVSVSVPHLLALALVLRGRHPGYAIALFTVFLALQALVARGLIGWHFVG